jgi:hypothetical protein
MDGCDTQSLHQSEDHQDIGPANALPSVEQGLPDKVAANGNCFPSLDDLSPHPSTNPPTDPGMPEDVSSSTPGALNDLDATGTGCELCTFAELSENQGVELAEPILPSAATIPVLARHSMDMMLRIFRTWPRMVAKGIQLPPIIHSAPVLETTEPTPLGNCFTLVKMWDGQSPGSESIVKETLKREMQSLLDKVCYDCYSLMGWIVISL